MVRRRTTRKGAAYTVCGCGQWRYDDRLTKEPTCLCGATFGCKSGGNAGGGWPAGGSPKPGGCGGHGKHVRADSAPAAADPVASEPAKQLLAMAAACPGTSIAASLLALAEQLTAAGQHALSRQQQGSEASRSYAKAVANYRGLGQRKLQLQQSAADLRAKLSGTEHSLATIEVELSASVLEQEAARLVLEEVIQQKPEIAEAVEQEAEAKPPEDTKMEAIDIDEDPDFDEFIATLPEATRERIQSRYSTVVDQTNKKARAAVAAATPAAASGWGSLQLTPDQAKAFADASVAFGKAVKNIPGEARSSPYKG